MVNNKAYEFITLDSLLSSVRAEMKAYEDMGLIDENNLIKVVMKCNEKLGLVFSEMKQVILDVEDFKTHLPLDFYKVFYMCALDIRHFSVNNLTNPWNNTVDQTITYEADIKRGIIGRDDKTTVIYKKSGSEYIQNYTYWYEMGLSKYRMDKCHHLSPLKSTGNYVADIVDDELVLPFREGEMYMMYLAAMRDEQGNVLVPFHPLITPWYEWCIKEKVFTDVIMNSDDTNVIEKYKLAQKKMDEAWLDAWNFTSDRTYREMIADKKQRELRWYSQYFALLK